MKRDANTKNGHDSHLRYNGCKYHKDCFTCPFKDCIAGDGSKIPLGTAQENSIHAEEIICNIRKW